MSTTSNPGFNPFAPGFDFLQGLVKGASATGGSAVPPLGQWVAPTMDPEELDKRISELKTVRYWLDQNTKALSATIQAMEVQKMTLATLKDMNLNLSDIAKAFQAPAASAPDTSATPSPDLQAKAAPTPEPAPSESAKKPTSASPNGLVDPMQMWSALTQQFQHIAASAMQNTPTSTRPESSAPAPQPSQALKNKKAAKTSQKGTTIKAVNKKTTARPPAKSASKRSA